MKTLGIIIICFLIPVLGSANPGIQGDNRTQEKELKGTIRVLSSPELMDVSMAWANEYESLNPKLAVRISESGNESNNELLPSGFDIKILYDDDQKILDEDLTSIILGREIIVPVINPDNPYIELLRQKGVSKQQLALLLNSRDSKNWGKLLGNGGTEPVNMVMTDDPMVIEAVANFTGLGNVYRKAGFTDGKSVIKTVSENPNALGFCKMSDIINNSGREFKETISLLPLDKNSNGILESHENIFNNYESFTRGVWIGKYPKELYKSIYSLSEKNQPRESVVAFLGWIVSSGQKNLVDMGYDDIVYNEKRANMNALFMNDFKKSNTVNWFAGQRLLALILGLFIVTGLFINIIARFLANRESFKSAVVMSSIPVLDIKSIKTKNGLHFDRSHMWAFMDEDGNVKTGIDDFLQRVTGPITSVKMKLPGERVKKGEKIMTIIQRGKRLCLYSPVSGIIRENNPVLENDAGIINSSPYKDGWIYVIEPSNWLAEIQDLLMGPKYLGWIKHELLRLKDFVAESLGSNLSLRPGLVLQEGGEIKDGILNDFGPELWEEFQSNFIDKKE